MKLSHVLAPQHLQIPVRFSETRACQGKYEVATLRTERSSISTYIYYILCLKKKVYQVGAQTSAKQSITPGKGKSHIWQ